MSDPMRPRLHSACFCLVSEAAIGSIWQAWTVQDIDEVLTDEDFFFVMAQSSIQPGDRIELFEVGDINQPESNVIAMREVVVSKIETDREGKHVRFFPIAETLRFSAAPSEGISTGEWAGKYWVYRDGKRHMSFPRMDEMSNAAEWMKRNPERMKRTAA